MSDYPVTRFVAPHSSMTNSAALSCVAICAYHVINDLFLTHYSTYCVSYRTYPGAQKEGGGPNVFMRESLNLVDFFVSNYVTQDVDLSTLEVRSVMESERGRKKCNGA